MIRNLGRLLALLALALAVPAQGAAALGGGVCLALGHHPMPSAAETGVAHVEAADHTGSSSGSMPHNTPAGPAALAGSCVACAAAASISLSLDVSSAPAPDAAVGSTPVSPPPDVLAHRLDRPPLTLPA